MDENVRAFRLFRVSLHSKYLKGDDDDDIGHSPK
jgi:hypothetical protein